MNNLTEFNVANLLSGLQAMLAYQQARQEALQDARLDLPSCSTNIAGSWLPEHFVVNMLDAVIEEAVEAKRLIKARKWWSNPESVSINTAQLFSPTPERTELVEELADVFIVWLNVLVYLQVSAPEFINVLTTKLEKNNPSNPKATIGNRS